MTRKSDQASYSSHRFNWLLHRYEVISEFRKLKKEIDIVKIPVCSPKKTKKIVSKSRDKEYYTDIFYVPDPLKSFWEANGKSLNECPSNFQWLVRVLSEICEASEDDIYKQYLKHELKYISAINISENIPTQISFAEGEVTSEL
ncbi:UNVERIFIED_CONTAM: hypothetical protein RMT77_019316 [Armadillidium vulgare]